MHYVIMPEILKMTNKRKYEEQRNDVYLANYRWCGACFMEQLTKSLIDIFLSLCYSL